MFRVTSLKNHRVGINILFIALAVLCAGVIAPPVSAKERSDPMQPFAKRKTPIKKSGVTYPVRVYRSLNMPNDPQAGQWSFLSSNLPVAWDIPAEGTPSTLAIIDTGVALNHEEFTNRWYTNQGETGTATGEEASKLNCTDRSLELNANCNLVDENGDGIVDNEVGEAWYENPSQLNCTDRSLPLQKECNRIDDDNNGFADDVHGWDFINYDSSVQAGENNPYGYGTTHGTAVAGIAAATGNNGTGIAGIDWSAKILPIQALDDDGYGDTKSVGKAINYAVDRGADVVNISIGTTLEDPFVKEAIQNALRKGVTVVAAAGNDGCDCITYPAAFPEVVAVGAIGKDGLRASFSSYGTNLDISAPGVDMSAPTWTKDNATGAYADKLNGTSFASPMVSGILSRLKSQRSAASPTQITSAVTETANRTNVTTPHDTQLGFGKLDAGSGSARMSTPLKPKKLQPYAVSTGAYLIPSLPFEQAGKQQYTYRCPPSIPAGTRIYSMQKAGDTFATISSGESAYAKTIGYMQKKLFYGCVSQPHDDLARSGMRVIQAF